MDRVAASDPREWKEQDRLEHHLWNELLPHQRPTGEFGLQGEKEPAISMEQILGRAITATGDGVVIGLPFTGSIAGEVGGDAFTIRTETRYPQQGFTSVTFGGGNEADGSLSIRVPPFGQAIQLIRNGQSCALEWQQGCLRLPGPWKPGDNVTVRFGIPIRVFRAAQDPLEDRAMDRSHPGAPAVEGLLFHGYRALVPAPPLQAAKPSAEESDLAVGVRKDGVLLLQPTLEHPESPFAEEGDFFYTAGENSRLVTALALWSSITDTPPPPGPWRIAFQPYATAFDKGA